LKTYEQFLEDLKKLRILAQKHCIFNKEEFESNFEIATKLAKWVDLKQQYLMYYQQIEQDKNKLYRDLYEYYKTEYHLNIETKDELRLFIETDKNYQEIFQKYKLLKQIIKFIDDVIDVLKNKLWEIKYYIDWQKFINGVV